MTLTSQVQALEKLLVGRVHASFHRGLLSDQVRQLYLAGIRGACRLLEAHAQALDHAEKMGKVDP